MKTFVLISANIEVEKLQSLLRLYTVRVFV